MEWLIYRSSHPEVFCRKSVFENFTKFKGKRLSQSLFFDKATPEAFNFIEKGLQHRFFPVNMRRFLRTPFFIDETLTLAASEFMAASSVG